MPRLRFFWKIYLTYVAMIVVTTVIVGVLVSNRVAHETREEIRSGLEVQARVLSEIAGPDLDRRPEVLERRVTGLSALGTRITLIDADGRVIADSEEDPAVMDRHDTRPEILEAKSRGVGASSRISQTIGEELLYVAVRIGEPDRIAGYARASIPLTLVRERLTRIRGTVFLGALIAAVAALLLGYLVARRLTGSLRGLSAAVQDIAAGNYDRRILLDPGDELGDLSKSFNTMTEQLRLRMDQITRDRNQLRAILGAMVEGVVAVDADERVLHINQVAESILGVTDREAVGKPIWEVTRAHELAEVIEECRETGFEAAREVELAGFGEVRTVELSAAPLTRKDGTTAGVVLVLHDVTKLRHLQLIRQDFVANASHELKTPIAAIRGLVETILDDESIADAKRREFLDRIRAQSLRLTSLVSDLLAISRVEKGDVDVGTVTDLVEIVNEAHRSFESPAQMKNVALTVRTPDGHVRVSGRASDLQQVVDNLVDNAIKYTPPGGTVEVMVAHEGGETGFMVRDTGPGIERRHQDRIFERFYRVDAARSRELGGTGLGLAIVKHLVQSLGGRVWVESEFGAGSTFLVRLPAARV